MILLLSSPVVCRFEQDLCYSTLGVSVSDNPKLKQQAQQQQAQQYHEQQRKPAHLRHHRQLPPPQSNVSGSSHHNPLAKPKSENRITGASGKVAAGASARKRASTAGGSNGTEDRRPIPLTRLAGAGVTPRNHLSYLAMSIKNAATSKRCGGTTIAAVSCSRGDADGCCIVD